MRDHDEGPTYLPPYKYYKREFSFSIFPKVHPLSDGEKMTRFRQQVTVIDVNLGLYDSYYIEDNRVFNLH